MRHPGQCQLTLSGALGFFLKTFGSLLSVVKSMKGRRKAGTGKGIGKGIGKIYDGSGTGTEVAPPEGCPPPTPVGGFPPNPTVSLQTAPELESGSTVDSHASHPVRPPAEDLVPLSRALPQIQTEAAPPLPPPPVHRDAVPLEGAFRAGVNEDPAKDPPCAPRDPRDPCETAISWQDRTASFPPGEDGKASNGNGVESGMEPDESLLKRLRDGEEGALGPLWSRYAALLYSQALGVLHNPTEAEDVVAEVFSEVWRRAAGYHPERARPVAWLVTLVRRRSIDRLRERRSYEKAGMRLAMESEGNQEYGNSNGDEPHGDGVEEQVHLSELRALLEQALRYLPERQRETVCMVYFHGLTQKEISARTSTPLGTVKTRLELGLRKMRERIRGTRLRSLAQDRGP